MQVTFTPEFKRSLRILARKYRHIRSDVQPVIERIERGEFPGDRIVGTCHVVYKTRIKNSDIRRGKSSGYRLIYYVKDPNLVVLITIYSKLDQADISAKQIKKILAEFDSLYSQRP